MSTKLKEPEIPDEVYLKLGVLAQAVEDQSKNLFYQLEKQVCELRHKHMLKNPEPPTKVFVGFKQMEAFHHVPPRMSSTRQEQLGTAEFIAMEVIRVVRDDFPMVA